MNSLSRREFIVGTCVFTGGLTLGGLASKAFASEGELLRPPGGQDEELFRALCIKCDRCRSVCPQHCVETADVLDGFVVMRTPKLNFHKGLCDFCGKCQAVCPTVALGAFDPEVDKIGIAEIDREKCIAYTQGTCVVCKDSCPYEALDFESGRPAIIEDRCNGCGACVLACNVNVNRTYGGGSQRAIEVVPVAKEGRAR